MNHCSMNTLKNIVISIKLIAYLTYPSNHHSTKTFVMKHLIYAAIISIALFTACKGKSGGGGGSSQDTPEAAAQMVFDAAKSGDYSSLKNLCDASLEPDKDSKMICEVTTGDEELKTKFKEYFAKG